MSEQPVPFALHVPEVRDYRSAPAADEHALPRADAGRALGVRQRRRLHAGVGSPLAELRLAQRRGAGQRAAAMQGALHGIDLHFLHVPGEGPDPCPLLLSHGWPGSVLEFLELIPRLTDPARFGGDPADAFTVVAPSLPGYTLSFAPGQTALWRRGDRRLLRRADDRRAGLPAGSPPRAATGARSSPHASAMPTPSG